MTTVAVAVWFVCVLTTATSNGDVEATGQRSNRQARLLQRCTAEGCCRSSGMGGLSASSGMGGLLRVTEVTGFRVGLRSSALHRHRPHSTSHCIQQAVLCGHLGSPVATRQHRQ